jgi:hypothetical protein
MIYPSLVKRNAVLQQHQWQIEATVVVMEIFIHSIALDESGSCWLIMENSNNHNHKNKQ